MISKAEEKSWNSLKKKERILLVYLRATSEGTKFQKTMSETVERITISVHQQSKGAYQHVTRSVWHSPKAIYYFHLFHMTVSGI